MSDWSRPVVHWALEARDAEAMKTFYAALFNWKIGDGPIMSIEPGIGGPEPGPGGHIAQHTDRLGFSLYVQVRDIKESLVRAVELGGSKESDPFDVPGGPTIAFVKDPEGNPLTLVQQ